ncbi:MAG: dephospho-CoA kinase [Legionellaceae bacterium]|nr:dephospho-CoA kinase [Legionellaceae bacterium]
MFCVGLTGSIASGKSTAAKIFKSLGAKVISADQISRDITAPNQNALNQITKKFGVEILNDKGELRRDKLREIIFNNKDDRIWLEKLLHPIIRTRILEEIKLCQENYCIIEIPLLTKRDSFPYLDIVILIKSDINTQIQRIMSRDNTSELQAKNILAAQPSSKTYLSVADIVIENNTSLTKFKKELVDLTKEWGK